MKTALKVSAVFFAVVLVALPFLLSTCHPAKGKYAYGWERYVYPTLKGRVVDAKTGAPVDDALIFCIWRVTRGLPGLTHEGVYKIVDTATDKDGRFTVPGTWNPLVNPPDLSVYKKGYVLWNARDVFPDNKRRDDFSWKPGVTIRLENWKQEYSYDEHQWFAGSHPSYSFDKRRYGFFRAMMWEKELAANERRAKSLRERGHQ